MHNLEPFFNWDRYYDSSEDEYSPFYGKEYNYDLYTDAIYNYYIAPGWDYMGSETLYIKILFAEYELGYAIIEFIGEWNDAISNDIMHLKRNVIDHLTTYGINKFILIGENVFNFHGSDDSYYEEWFEDVEDGWIAAVNFRDFIHAEWQKYYLDTYINFGGNLEIVNWRTLMPRHFCEIVNRLISRRLALPE